jgi:copper transport protein
MVNRLTLLVFRTRIYRIATVVFLSVLVSLTVALLSSRNPALAHAELERSNPAADAVLAAPPQRIDLWFTEAIASGGGSPTLRVLDESGKSLPVTDLAVDPNDSHHVSAAVSGVGFGTFTVVWSNRSEDDGHSLSGTYAFRVGGTSRAPGAATVEGKTPRTWAVATRWLTFLAGAISAAGFLISFLVFANDEEPGSIRRRIWLIFAAAIVGIIATAFEPFLQSRFPPSGTIAPSFSDAFNGLPNAWFLRIPALAVAAVVALTLVVRPELRPLTWLRLIGASAGLIAILGLALTSHASARENWRIAATSSVIVHQWAVGLWVGGLIQLLVARPFQRDANGKMPIQRFSFWALFLALIGITTGVINAGFVLPAINSVWESDYGRVILFKVAVLVPVLALATYHRLTLRKALDRAASAFRLTLRIETALIVIVVLGGSTLALLAPPSGAKGGTASVDLAAELPSPGGQTNTGQYAQFKITPAAQGENELSVAVTATKPVDLDANAQLVEAPPMTDVALVRVTLTNLNQPIAPVEVELTSDPSGWFHSGKLQLGLDGWWRADVLVRRLGVEDVTVPFYIMLPDPNVHGESAVPIQDSTDDAKAVFDQGLNALLSLTSIHSTERLSGGTGTIVVSDHITHAATDGSPASMRIATSDSEVIRTGGFQWVRDTGGEWSKTDAPDVVPPSEWGTDYENATGFRLGNQETVGEKTAQIVSFYVPSDVYASAWYCWWVDVDTGNLLQETMVSRGHYMLRQYDDFDSAPPITPPSD